MTCENCGRDEVPEGAHCNNCGHQNRLPVPQIASPSRTAEYVSGSLIGVFLGGIATLVLCLGGTWLMDVSRPWLQPGVVWAAETLVVLAATIYLFSRRGRRQQPFIWSMFVATAFVALGGLAVCDAILFSTWNTK